MNHSKVPQNLAGLALACFCYLPQATLAQSIKTCAGLPVVEAVTTAGWCLGVVADAQAGLRMPRHVMWLGSRRVSGQSETDFLIVDMGGWEVGKGRVLHMIWSSTTQKASFKELLTGLDRPHGLERGPDGALYLGEATRISRMIWSNGQLSKPQPLVQNLPAEGRHPLKALVFGADRNLYFNVGAGSDRCQSGASKKLPLKNGLPHCTEMDGSQPQAAVYVAKMKWPGAQVELVEPYSLGLRNSMALAAHPNGTLLQAENSIDFPDEQYPPEEINILQKGKHYGWPICVGQRAAVPGYTAADCKLTQNPAVLMPAHAAPLHMTYSTESFAADRQDRNKLPTSLLVSWHGHRDAGQKIVSYSLNAHGAPVGQPKKLITQWKVASKKNHAKSGGAPVAWAQDDHGHLWIADDRNKMIVWFGREKSVP